MRDLIRRGFRLLRSNPRLFFRRLLDVALHPVWGPQILSSISRTHREIESAYITWVDQESASPNADPGPPDGPLLSVILPVYNADPRLLQEAIESVRRQEYERWELCMADDASDVPYVAEVLSRHANLDSRIKVEYRTTTGHIAAASNSALTLAKGEFIILLDHDDLLRSGALALVARTISENPDVDLIYSDEDKVDPEGRRSAPFFKPAWSPSLLMSCNYITHMAALRRRLVLDVGGFRDEMAGSQDHDLFLRVSEVARSIAHIPHVLYSWRTAPGSAAASSSAKLYAIDASRRAIASAVRRRGLRAEVTQSSLNGIFILRQEERLPLDLSLVVTGRGNRWHQLLHWEGLGIRDVLCVQGAEEPPASVTVPLVDSFASLHGEYLLFMDAGSRARSRDCVTALMEELRLSGATVVGGVTFRSGKILQAGLRISDGGQPLYAFEGIWFPPYRDFYLNLKDLPREVAAIWSGSCLMRRETWERLGGWQAELGPELAMVDFCLRAWVTGEATLCTPLAEFERTEPLPRIPSVESLQWPWQGFRDPFSNPNLNPFSPTGVPFRHSGALTQVHTGTQMPAPV